MRAAVAFAAVMAGVYLLLRLGPLGWFLLCLFGVAAAVLALAAWPLAAIAAGAFLVWRLSRRLHGDYGL